ncbi:MAG: hypothetical protein ACUVQL_05875, partial [Candidatus Bathycorpusculaceae bacterium]
MAGSTIDHLVSVTVFLGAILLFISLFNQTIQTAILYQRHRYLATKCSDLLDNMLLNPGVPENWGKSNVTPYGFGLQDPEFTQYKLSPFSLMRLQSLTGTPFTYPRTGVTYSNLSTGFGNFLFVPYTIAIDYSTVARLLGINNTFGFKLSITPIVTISIEETRAASPLTLTINVAGAGFPLSNAEVSYCFLKVNDKGSQQNPSYTSLFGTTYTDSAGVAVVNIQDVDASTAYAFIAYAHISGLVGTGYHERVSGDKEYVLPLIDSFEDRRVLLVHSYNVHDYGPPESAVFFNATFVLLTEDFALREMPMENSTGKLGKVVYGNGTDKQWVNITIPTFNPGILIVTYQSNKEYGVVLMPWGLSSMAFPIVFGG